MMHRFAALCVLALLATGTAAAGASPSATASAAASASPVPTPAPDPAVLARAEDWFGRIEAGAIDRSQLTPEMNRALTDASLKDVASQMAPRGKAKSFEQVQTGSKDGSAFYVYSVTLASGDRWLYVFALDLATKKISGLRVAPAP